MIRKDLLSIVIPCFNEETNIKTFYSEVKKYVGIKPLNVNYELIFVNDGSKDNTINEILELKKTDRKIKLVDLSRNFGKEGAMLAGLEVSKGDYVITMDCDLQDPPSLLPEMYNILKSDSEYDCVAIHRLTRAGEPPLKTFFSKAFYKMINKMIEVEIVDGARDCRMMRRDMVNAILLLKEHNRFSKGIFPWVGFNTKYIGYENIERASGESKYSLWNLFKYAIDGITAFTTTPLRISTIIGVIVSALGFLYMTFIIIKAIFFGDPVAGFPSLIAIISILGGIQLLMLGIIGEYLARTYIETKNRPHYIIKRIL